MQRPISVLHPQLDWYDACELTLIGFDVPDCLESDSIEYGMLFETVSVQARASQSLQKELSSLWCPHGRRIYKLLGM